MTNNTRYKQLILIGAVVLVIGFLFTRDIKGLVKPNESEQGAAATQAEPGAGEALNLTEISTTGKNMLNVSLSKEITALENDFKASADADKAKKAKALAQKWDDLEQAIPSALYLEIAATQEPSLSNWVLTGDRFLKAFDNTRDSVMQPALLSKANLAFTSAMALDSTSADAKTGLGITIVNGMGMPMKGIAMLMEVVKADPKNLKANMSLGTFAIKSGQFDKAITRFRDIIAIKPSPDAYFYLGTAYENLGRNAEAIDSYIKSKELAANPTLSEFIDKKVKELKEKN